MIFSKNIITAFLFVSLVLPQPTVAAAPDVVESLRSLNTALQGLIDRLPIGKVLGESSMDDHSNTHEPGSLKHTEHNAIFDFAAVVEATHVAARSGEWFDAATWTGGVVPGDNARVYIPEGKRVYYSQSSDARLFWVRVDGRLQFDTAAELRMVVDTVVVHPQGTLTIGTENNPIEGSVEIVFANNGDINVQKDRELLSRGLVSHGAASIVGEEKLVHTKVSRDPMAGDTSIRLAEYPEGWQAGDTIVIAGTRYRGYSGIDGSWQGTEDEVRIISAINGKSVSFVTPLEYDHDTPRSDLKTSVANYTRNITFRSEDGDATRTSHRGHVMFMHSDDVDVRYAAFWHLGRTDKSFPSSEVGGLSSVTPSANVRGRYSVHLHRTGVDDPAEPVIVLGNAVFDAPGWGYVHHDSNAIFHNNASYDVFGAGFVAETGNEIGTWTNNIAIKSQGQKAHPKKFSGTARGSTFDNGATGNGFFFQGRMMKSRDNIAASHKEGFVFLHRGSVPAGGTGPIAFSHELFDYPEAVYKGKKNGVDRTIKPTRVPILEFDRNEAFAAWQGLHVTKSSPRQGHQIYTDMNDFTAWNVTEGAHLAYTGQYVLRNFDIIGSEGVRGTYKPGESGITFWTNTYRQTVINPTISRMETGIDMTKGGVISKTNPAHTEYEIVNPDIDVSGTDITNLDLQFDRLYSSSDMVEGRFVLDNDVRLESDDTVSFTGTVTDGVGPRTIIHPSEETGQIAATVIEPLALRARLEDEGYLTNDGSRYHVVEHLYTDRLTGEVHKFGTVVNIDAAWLPDGASAVGSVDLSSRPPETEGEAVSARENDVTRIKNVLDNDEDPDGDDIRLDGFSQPRHGQAFLQGDDTILYRPDFDYTGEDVIKYWVTDDQGNYSPAYIAINVGGRRPDVIASPEPPESPEVEMETDSDNDGVPDAADNCPQIPNEDQLDSNNNNEGDACDGAAAAETPQSDDVENSVDDASEPTGNDVSEVTDEAVVEDYTTDTSLSRFDTKERVQTINNLNVRTGPGDNVIDIQPQGALGYTGTFDPVRAGEYVYIYVDFDSAPDGWVAEEFLVAARDAGETGVTDEVAQEDYTEAVERVRTTDNLNVRFSPNGEKLGVQSQGAYGSIDDPVRSTVAGIDWVYVNFDTDPDGYVADSYLVPAASSQSTMSQSAIRAQIAELLELLSTLQAMYDRLYGSR